jgi:cysteine-rich repeat protein
MKSSLSIAAAIATVVASTTAFAQTPDHLQCFKIKDNAEKAAYVATLAPTAPQLIDSAGCEIKVPAKLYCTEAEKQAVTPTPPGADPGAAAGSFLCYKTKCPAAVATITTSDQFGDHTLTIGKTGFVCAPTDTTPSGCGSASECPGMDTDCQVRSCSAGVCGFVFTAAGTPTMSQTSGDCQENVCNGMGNTSSQADDSDAPADDGNECTSQACSMGTPFYPALPNGSACSSGVCSSGMCVSEVCGDGTVAMTEQCDDGNIVGGDGCSSLCAVEVGFNCSGSPSTCSGTCGDGVIVGAETCDDAGLADGDGCSSSCQVEPGFGCTGSPSTCSATCGDGIIAGSEGCDDGGLGNGDGCSSVCEIEPGFSCFGQPSVCVPD